MAQAEAGERENTDLLEEWTDFIVILNIAVRPPRPDPRPDQDDSKAIQKECREAPLHGGVNREVLHNSGLASGDVSRGLVHRELNRGLLGAKCVKGLNHQRVQASFDAGRVPREDVQRVSCRGSRVEWPKSEKQKQKQKQNTPSEARVMFSEGRLSIFAVT